MKKNHLLIICGLPVIAVLMTAFFRPGLSGRTSRTVSRHAGLSSTVPLPVEGASGAAPGFAVVELFTSEGCSSCPPADQLLAKIDSEYKKSVYVLEFHVDYWDRLGWKDAFSSADYTHRQQDYSKFFRGAGIYTPQAVVNGTQQMIGSDESQLTAAIGQALGATRNSSLGLIAGSKDGTAVKVSWSIDDPGDATLQIALVQLQAASEVLRGENKGRHLQHVNIVRDFRSILMDKTSAGGTIKLKLPAGLTPKDCKVIAFLQSPDDEHIIRAGEAMIKEK